MKDGTCLSCFHRAKQGFLRLLGPDHAKTFEASYAVASQILSRDEEFAEKVRLFELAQELLPDEQVTYYLANDIGSACLHKGMYEDAQYHYVLALQGRLRVLGSDHKDTLMSLTNLGIVHKVRVCEEERNGRAEMDDDLPCSNVMYAPSLIRR